VREKCLRELFHAPDTDHRMFFSSGGGAEDVSEVKS
jgi:hypothetical protein